MIYIKVHGESPFVIVCDGKYMEQLAYQRLDRWPFTYSKTEIIGKVHNLPEITCTHFLNMHA